MSDSDPPGQRSDFIPTSLNDGSRPDCVMSYHVAIFAPRIAVVSAATIVDGVTTKLGAVFGAAIRALASLPAGSAGTEEASVAPRQPARIAAIQNNGTARL